MGQRNGSADRLQAILASIAAEDPADRRERWQGLFDRMAGERANRVVLFGAGQLGRLVLGSLRAVDVEPCCFSDNNPELWGSRVDDLEVLSPADAVRQFGQLATFVTTIIRRSSPVRGQLRALGCSVVSAPVLFWKYPASLMPDIGIDTPERLAEQAEQICACHKLLADERSRHELCDQVEWQYWMKPEFLPLPVDQGEEYFPGDLLTESDHEVVVDGGAFDGDSIRSFISHGRSFRHLYALEPDNANRAALRESLQQMPALLRDRITVWPYALGDKDEIVSFVEAHDMGSRISSTGDGLAIEGRRLDSLPWQLQPTYIKLDIEGSELAALSGGAALLKREMPVLAVCVYHRMQHLWQIPNLIHSLAPGYSFYLRRYAEDCWEKVCYAVPLGRKRAS